MFANQFTRSMKTITAAIILASSLLSGCNTEPSKPIVPAAPIVITPMPTPAEQAADAAEAERINSAAASAKATALALEHAPASTPVELAAGETKIVTANLPAPTEPALAVAIGRVMAGLNGDLAMAKREQAQALEDANTLRKRLEKLEADAAKERKAAADLLNGREAAWAGKFTEQQRSIAELNRQLQEAKDATSKRVQFWFGLILRLVAAGLLLVAGLKAKAAIASGLPSGEAVRGSLATLALAAGGFSLSWAVAQWWFFWACGVFAVLVFGTWAAHAYFADKAKGTLNKIGKAIDAGVVKDGAGQAVSATVDLVSLSRAMDSDEKAIVNKLRDVRSV